MSATFESLGLSPETMGALRRARYAAPTPIQAQAIPPALAGRDVIGCAATGTGKTAAYVLPLVERLAGEPALQAPQAGGKVSTVRGVVLAPTRELAQQIAEQVSFFGDSRGLTSAALIGGADARAQLEALGEGPALVVATPGRLVEMLQAGAVSLGSVRILVLDEADRMLEMGFRPELEQVLAAVPREHQTLLFSATLGHDVTLFAQEALRKPVRVEVTPSGTPAARATQRLYEVELEEKLPLLLTLLAADQLPTLVFTRTRQRADRVQDVLREAGHKAAVIHSDRTQGQRKQALEAFRRGKYRVLVATDIASRGLDIEDVGHVINFDLPYSPQDYVHRIGRTARAGASGRASSFVLPQDLEALEAVERVIHMPVPRAKVPRQDRVFLEALEEFSFAKPGSGALPDERAERARPAPRPRPAARPGSRPGGRRAAGERSREESRPLAPKQRSRTAPAREGERSRGAPGRGTGKGVGKGRSRAGAPGRPGGRAGGGRSAGGRGGPSRGGPAKGRGGGGRRGR